MDWLAEALGLPEIFRFSSDGYGGGCFQGTASQGVLNACLVARDRILRSNDIGKKSYLS